MKRMKESILENAADQDVSKPYKEIDPPFLVLISGATLTGKSTVAQLIYSYIDLNFEMNSEKIKLVSTDHVRNIMRKYIS